MSVSLLWLLEGIASLPAEREAWVRAAPAREPRIADLTLDSRASVRDTLFLALPGTQAHGLAFAAEAAARGASVVLWDPEGAPQGEASTAMAFDDPRVFAAPVIGLKHLAGRIADRFFGSPSASLRIIGITGTNGKTTCAYLLAQCLERLHGAAAYIGTIGRGRVGALLAPTHTTPDTVSLHRQLAELRDQGIRDVALEVSSHALDQGRVDAVRFHTAAFTNLTRDHLDYHGSMQAYGAAKARLFDRAGLRHIVIHTGDAFGRTLAARHRGAAALTRVCIDDEVADVTRAADGADEVADADARVLRGSALLPALDGLSMTVSDGASECALHTPLLGRFNAENAVVVLGCLTACGTELTAAAAALGMALAPPGRMERVASRDAAKPVAVVDYAHTPDALAKALRAVREHCRGELWCVFGCGGDRDPGKRPMMGAAAEGFADRVIVTDDNPRTEEPGLITADILAGMTAAPVVIHDRAQAIAAALEGATGGDMVLIAGKGHEDYQIYGATRRAFSDRREALRHLGEAA